MGKEVPVYEDLKKVYEGPGAPSHRPSASTDLLDIFRNFHCFRNDERCLPLDEHLEHMSISK